MPAQWTDSAGRDWPISISVNTVRRVKEMLSVDLLDVFDGELFTRLANDPVMLVNVLYVVCKPIADSRGITDEQFGELLVGDTIDTAATALVQGIIAFFPQARRDVLTRLWAAQSTATSQGTAMVSRKLTSEAMDAAIAAAVANAENEIDQRLSELGKPSTNSPATSA